MAMQNPPQSGRYREAAVSRTPGFDRDPGRRGSGRHTAGAFGVGERANGDLGGDGDTAVEGLRLDTRDLAGDADGLRSLAGPRPRRRDRGGAFCGGVTAGRGGFSLARLRRRTPWAADRRPVRPGGKPRCERIHRQCHDPRARRRQPVQVGQVLEPDDVLAVEDHMRPVVAGLPVVDAGRVDPHRPHPPVVPPATARLRARSRESAARARPRAR